MNSFVCFFDINTHQTECVNLSQAEFYRPILCKHKWRETPRDRQPQWAEYRRLQNTVALWNSSPIQSHSATSNSMLSNCITPHSTAFHSIPPHFTITLLTVHGDKHRAIKMILEKCFPTVYREFETPSSSAVFLPAGLAANWSKALQPHFVS